MGTYKNACIVAAQVRKKSLCAANIARKPAVKAETEVMRWLDEQDELEKQIIINQLFKTRTSHQSKEQK